MQFYRKEAQLSYIIHCNALYIYKIKPLGKYSKYFFKKYTRFFTVYIFLCLKRRKIANNAIFIADIKTLSKQYCRKGIKKSQGADKKEEKYLPSGNYFSLKLRIISSYSSI